MVVVECYYDIGCVGLGIVKGFGLIEGVIVMIVVYDFYNIVVVGISDEVMKVVIDYII